METMGAKAGWQRMAVIEMDEEVGDLHRLVAEPRSNYEFRRSNSAPAGFIWFDLHVDASHGAYPAARTAGMVLDALERLAGKGAIHNLRIVTGGEWLDIGKELQPSLRSGVTLPP